MGEYGCLLFSLRIDSCRSVYMVISYLPEVQSDDEVEGEEDRPTLEKLTDICIEDSNIYIYKYIVSDTLSIGAYIQHYVSLSC